MSVRILVMFTVTVNSDQHSLTDWYKLQSQHRPASLTTQMLLEIMANDLIKKTKIKNAI